MSSDLIARGMATNANRNQGVFAYNTDIGLRRWRSALATIQSGASAQFLNVPVIGDSITEGQYAGNDTPADFATLGFVGRLRTAFAKHFEDVGIGMIPTYYPSAAPTTYWTFTGSWTQSNWGVTAVGQQSSTNGDTATFNFTGTGVGIVVGEDGNGGTFTASVDGGAPTSYNTNSASTIQGKSYEITGLSYGSHTLTITSTVTGGQVIRVNGAYPINGTSGVRVHMCGRAGIPSGYAINTTALYNEIDLWNPPLTIIAMGANDYNTNVPVSTYRTNMQIIIDRALQYGDCLLVSTGLQPTTAGAIPQDQYIQAQYDLAMQNNIAFLDIYNRWSGNYDYVKNTLGIYYDTVHPNDYGHQDIANALVKVLLENDKFPVSTVPDDNWVQPAFENGWSNYANGTAPIAFRKDSDGYVHFQGTATGGTIGSTAAIFTLPVGYRPANKKFYAVLSNSALGSVIINATDGTVVAWSGSNAWFSIDNIPPILAEQ